VDGEDGGWKRLRIAASSTKKEQGIGRKFRKLSYGVSKYFISRIVTFRTEKNDV
jgi:hypothetical protein